MPFNPKPLPLSADRVTQFQAELDAFIDERAKVVARDCPGVPLGVVRNILTVRAAGCQCRQYLEIIKQDDAA